jgi:hypothetical protein
MIRQPAHPDQADMDGRMQAYRVSEWGLKMSVPGRDLGSLHDWSLCVLLQDQT